MHGLINSGQLSGYWIGRVIRVRRVDFDRYLDRSVSCPVHSATCAEERLGEVPTSGDVRSFGQGRSLTRRSRSRRPPSEEVGR
jgi:hypothetical protein